MRTRLFGSLSIALLVLSACGSSDDSSDSADGASDTVAAVDTTGDEPAGEPAGEPGDGSPQDQVADMLVDEMGAEGMTIDRDCARDAASKLSDDDARKILDAGVDGDPDVSDDAMKAAENMVSCIDTDQVVDQMIANMVDTMGEENVDVDCMKDALKDLDLANMDDDGGEVATAMTQCVKMGG